MEHIIHAISVFAYATPKITYLYMFMQKEVSNCCYVHQTLVYQCSS